MNEGPAYRPIPVIATERLILRPFALDDAPEVQRLAGAREIAEVTANLPHPYPDGAAELWIATHAPTLTAAGHRRGADVAHNRGAHRRHQPSVEPNERAELGYWLGVPYQGMATAPRRRARWWTMALAMGRATHLCALWSNPPGA